MAQLNTSNPTIHGATVQLPVAPTDVPPGPANDKHAGFQRKPGLMTRLREGLARLKEKFDTGQSQRRLTRALQRLPANDRATATSHIRKSDTRSDPMLIRPEDEKRATIQRHNQLLLVIRDSSAPGFKDLSPEARIQVLSALDLCMNLSDTSSLEGLMMLSECIDALMLAQAKDETSQKASVPRPKLNEDLTWLKRECSNQISKLSG